MFRSFVDLTLKVCEPTSEVILTLFDPVNQVPPPLLPDVYELVTKGLISSTGHL